MITPTNLIRYTLLVALAACSADRPPPATVDAVVAASAPRSVAPPASAPPAPSAPRSARAVFAPGECGRRPRPAGPLQSWMKSNMAPAVIERDFAELARAFDDVARFGPDGFTDWRAIAFSGADAARRNDYEDVKGACRACHSEYQKRYQAERRQMPLPIRDGRIRPR